MDNSFVSGYLVPFVIIVVEILVIVVPLLIAVAYLTYAERRPPRKAYFEFDAQPAMMMP